MTADRDTAGRLIGIACRPQSRAPMQQVADGDVSLQQGLAGDCKGSRFPNRQITVLSREAWEVTLADLARVAGLVAPPRLLWTARRANLLVEGVALPSAIGGRLRIGPVELEITHQTYPCRRMDEAWTGLRKALAPDWRGGVTCRVLVPGRLCLGDSVEVLQAPPRRMLRLPG